MDINIEDRIYELQYFTGYRIAEDESPDFKSVDEVAPWFTTKLMEMKDIDRTQSIHLTYVIKEEAESIIGKEIAFDTDLNDYLNTQHKAELYSKIKEKHNIELVPLVAPPFLQKLIQFLALGGIFGGLLFSTYAVFMLLWSGWIFLLPLGFLLLTFALIATTEKSRTHIPFKNAVDLAQATIVIEKNNIPEEFSLNEEKTLHLIQSYFQKLQRQK